ncbi:helix-turn-helix transcriptional regulator [Anaerosacchariphilus sp. NSJ-68]|uniref:Helix-turn-helix transcriptional regulator n=2 Tax=Lachnospiraceae TaxID=186803 RepID=A0A923LA18_9FIRM|nr:MULTISPECIES: helix-turn-helix transcriptional regulator [Lachnospiraceae]MBC5658497.1 helix-turn-helix transcriptional regulator [Anaerosacchariphilus hominis]MBC5698294.1 helix-turn-helix transcriptional regulator [Roseburia difficilis]
MILADKIIRLRKKAGWSQEELAERLGVTRQSVSKWEGAQSVPDIEKILQMSRIFGVTTDYLLKDELDEEETLTPLASMALMEEAATDTPLRRITLEEASEYLKLRKRAAPKMALATALCVLSPVVLIALSSLSEYSRLGIGENMAAGIGLCVLIILVAAGVGLFLSCGFQVKAYEYLDTEPFERADGVERMVREEQAAHQPFYAKCNIFGTLLCILAVLPFFVALTLNIRTQWSVPVCILLVLVAVACYAFVYGGTYQNAMKRLLEEGDYTRASKARSKLLGTVSGCYWLVVTAIFLFYTFGPNGNGQPQYSWFIWAVAGVLFGAVVMAVKVLWKGPENNF